MDPVTLAALSSLANVGGGILGNILSSGDREKAEEALRNNLALYNNIQAPTLEQLKVTNLPEYQIQGQLSPEMVETIAAQSSLMNKISVDPSLKEAQQAALQKLSTIGNEGLTAQDRLALDQSTRKAAQENKSNQEAILQNMAARGQGGSGAELAAKLASSQAAADRANQEGLAIAAQAQQRALDAITRSGQLGGEMRTQDFNQQSAIAQAQDSINRFNAANSQDIALKNIAARNAAQEANLTNKQSVANSNVAARQKQIYHNTALPMSVFEANLKRAEAVSGANTKAGAFYQDRAGKTAEQWSKGGQGVSEGIAAFPTLVESFNKLKKPQVGG